MLALLAACFQADAQNLFESDEELTLKVTGPLNTLIRNREDENKYPFTLQVDGMDHQIMLSARGKSRKELCDFPPLRFYFDDSIPGNSLFSGQDQLKVVTHCFRVEKTQVNVLREYAAYRFFSLITDAAYRVRLARIVYEDTDGKQSLTRYGFFIESTESLAERVGGQRAYVSGVSRKSLNDRQEALVYVFQYMIGNTDWSMVTAEGDDECCHNGKLIEKDQQLLYIPYDFDLSGVVKAQYARPDPSMNIASVTQRLYRGFCLNPEVLGNAIDEFNMRQDEFVTIVEDLPFPNGNYQKRTLRFLASFFKAIENKDKIMKSFHKRCVD
jgi:hypothetical protein